MLSNSVKQFFFFLGEEEDFELDEDTRDVTRDDELGENGNESVDKIDEEDITPQDGEQSQNASSDINEEEDDEDFVDVAESGW